MPSLRSEIIVQVTTLTGSQRAVDKQAGVDIANWARERGVEEAGPQEGPVRPRRPVDDDRPGGLRGRVKLTACRAGKQNVIEVDAVARDYGGTQRRGGAAALTG